MSEAERKISISGGPKHGKGLALSLVVFYEGYLPIHTVHEPLKRLLFPLKLYVLIREVQKGHQSHPKGLGMGHDFPDLHHFGFYVPSQFAEILIVQISGETDLERLPEYLDNGDLTAHPLVSMNRSS